MWIHPSCINLVIDHYVIDKGYIMSKRKNNRKALVTAPVTTPVEVVTEVVTPTQPEMITIPVELEVVTPAPTAPVTFTSSLLASAVSGYDIGAINLTSKRITPGTLVSEYRVCNNQRKNVGAVKYYVQGGTYQTDPISGKERFNVAIEIPHSDLYSAKLQLAQLR